MTDAATDDSGQVWRVSAAGRAGAAAVVGIWLLVALGLTLSGTDAFTATILWLFGIGGIVLAWRWAFVPFVALRATGVVIQNKWTCNVVPYSDISSVEPGYYGVLVRRRTGTPVAAWAVQKSNLRRWMGSDDTRADQLAAAIRTRAQGH